MPKKPFWIFVFCTISIAKYTKSESQKIHHCFRHTVGISIRDSSLIPKFRNCKLLFAFVSQQKSSHDCPNLSLKNQTIIAMKPAGFRNREHIHHRNTQISPPLPLDFEYKPIRNRNSQKTRSREPISEIQILITYTVPTSERKRCASEATRERMSFNVFQCITR